MNRLIQGAAVVPLLAMGAAAQDSPQAEMKKRMAADLERQVTIASMGSVRGPVVKGMPYSAEEITETDQKLGDGTRIHRETKTMVYRDSEGRTRRESPDSITINDPVAGATYIINPKTNSVRALKMASPSFIRRDAVPGVAIGGGGTVSVTGTARTTFEMRVDGDGPPNIVIDGKALDPKQLDEMIAKAKVAGEAAAGNFVFAPPGEPTMVTTGAIAVRKTIAAKGEPLGKKSVEGVIAEGTRSVQTIAVGEIGNDRPIQIVNEHWYSEEIGMTVMTRRSDPRTGEETFRMTNIRRGDPPAYLFQAPADSNAGERKM